MTKYLIWGLRAKCRIGYEGGFRLLSASFPTSAGRQSGGRGFSLGARASDQGFAGVPRYEPPTAYKDSSELAGFDELINLCTSQTERGAKFVYSICTPFDLRAIWRTVSRQSWMVRRSSNHAATPLSEIAHLCTHVSARVINYRVFTTPLIRVDSDTSVD
jgi:hypothetical protein